MKYPLPLFRGLLGSPAPDANTPDIGAPDAPHVEAPQLMPKIYLDQLPAALRDDVKFLSTLCTRLWRFERQLSRVAQSEPSDSHDRLVRRFESISEALREAEIEIIDHDGEKYDAGLNLTVLHFEPREELSREMIIETVKPSLVIRGLRMAGEVIVGQPVADETQTLVSETQPSVEENK